MQGLIFRPVSNAQFALGIRLSGKELIVESTKEEQEG